MHLAPSTLTMAATAPARAVGAVTGATLAGSPAGSRRVPALGPPGRRPARDGRRPHVRRRGHAGRVSERAPDGHT